MKLILSNLKQNIILYLCLFFCLFSFKDVKASHAMAVDITYECVGPNQYYFCVNFYRDCNGIPAPNDVTLSFNSASCNQSFTQTLAMTSGGGVEVSQLCPSMLNLSTCGSGSYAGVELYQYCGTITLPANCSDWVISYDICCRNDLIDNLVSPSTESLYVEVKLDNTNGICNNSVTYSSYPVLYGCAGNNMCFNHGAIDIDGDSLAYHLVDPKDNATTPISFVTGLGYNLNNPILSSTGFTFDNVTGQMCWNATGPQVCVISVLVEEWRDINGVPTLVGSSIREMQVIILTCNTSTPSLSGGLQNVQGGAQINSTTLEICPGGLLEFDMVFVDSDPAAELTLASNYNVVAPGSQLTQTGLNPINATFSWNVPANYAGQNIITFEITNDACLIPGKNYYAYNIYVLEGTTAGPDQIHCENGVPVQLSATGGTQFNWTNGNFLTCDTCANTIAAPDSTTAFIVTSDLSGTCGNKDTVLVNVVPTYSLDVGLDTSICLNELYPMSGIVGVIDSNMIYEWSPSIGLNDPSLQNVILDPVSPLTYYLETTSADGCKKLDSIVIDIAGSSPISNLIASDDSICIGEIINLDAMGEPQVCGISSSGCKGPQSQVTIANGTADDLLSTPYNGFFQDNKVQYLYRSSELISGGFLKGGTITSIGFDVSNKLSSTPFENFTIKIGCTSSNTLTAFVPGLSVVYNGNISTISGWNDYTLDSPYDWDGSSNLIVEICYNNSNFSFGTTDAVKSYFTSYISTCFESANGTVGCGLNNGTLGNQRANIRMSACFPSTGNYTFTWNPSTYLDNAAIQDPTSTPQGDIMYYVTITDGGICDTEDSIIISTRAPLVTTVKSDTTMCEGQAYQLGATGGDIYAWTPTGDLTNPNASNPVATPNSTTQYTVMIQDALYGCTVYEDLTININQLPQPLFSVDTVCLEDFSAFINQSQNGTGDIVEWHWDWGDGNNYVSTSFEAGVDYRYAISGNKTITLTVVDDKGCVNVYSGTAYVKSKPTADYTTNPINMEVLVGAQMQFNDISNGSISWLYYFDGIGGADTTTLQNPIHVFDSRGQYAVYQVVTNNESCTDTVVYNIDVIEDPQLNAPTAFSPNNDGVNDVIYAKALGVDLSHPDNNFSFKMFNRWGKLVFETNNINVGWNGEFNGDEQPVGTYVYVIEASTPEDEVMIKGNISLIR